MLRKCAVAHLESSHSTQHSLSSLYPELMLQLGARVDWGTKVELDQSFERLSVCRASRDVDTCSAVEG